MERRANDIQPEVDERDDSQTIRGVASVAYDGTPETEFVLREANEKLGQRRVVERILPGAFDDVLGRDADVRVLRNHHPDNLLGRTTSRTADVYIDNRSNLAYKLDAPDTQVGRDTVEMLRRGDLSGSSFAFTVGAEAFKDEGEVRAVEISRVENLYDVGPVTYPAYQATSAGIRSGDPQSVLKRFTEWEEEHDKAAEADAEAERVEKLRNHHATIMARAKLAGGIADADRGSGAGT